MTSKGRRWASLPLTRLLPVPAADIPDTMQLRPVLSLRPARTHRQAKPFTPARPAPHDWVLDWGLTTDEWFAADTRRITCPPPQRQWETRPTNRTDDIEGARARRPLTAPVPPEKAANRVLDIDGALPASFALPQVYRKRLQQEARERQQLHAAEAWTPQQLDELMRTRRERRPAQDEYVDLRSVHNMNVDDLAAIPRRRDAHPPPCLPGGGASVWR